MAEVYSFKTRHRLTPEELFQLEQDFGVPVRSKREKNIAALVYEMLYYRGSNLERMPPNDPLLNIQNITIAELDRILPSGIKDGMNLSAFHEFLVNFLTRKYSREQVKEYLSGSN